MKLTSLVSRRALAAGGYTPIQAPQRHTLPEPPKPPSPPWAQKEPLPPGLPGRSAALVRG
jgi:hypothetical protein